MFEENMYSVQQALSCAKKFAKIINHCLPANKIILFYITDVFHANIQIRHCEFSFSWIVSISVWRKLRIANFRGTKKGKF